MEIRDISSRMVWSGGMPTQRERSTMGCRPPSPALPEAPRARLSQAVCRERGRRWWPDPRGDLAADAILPRIVTLLAAVALFPFPTSWQQQPCLLLTLTLRPAGSNSLKTLEQEPGSED